MSHNFGVIYCIGQIKGVCGQEIDAFEAATKCREWMGNSDVYDPKVDIILIDSAIRWRVDNWGFDKFCDQFKAKEKPSVNLISNEVLKTPWYVPVALAGLIILAFIEPTPIGEMVVSGALIATQ